MKILVFTKTVDGGTGTFVLSLQKLNRYIKGGAKVKTLVLETPAFRQIENHKFTYLRKKNSYPEKYHLSFIEVINFLKELAWYKNHIALFNPDVVISVDVHCNLLSMIVKKMSSNNTKFILTTHINLSNTLSAKSSSLLLFVTKIMMRYLYKNADALVAVSRGINRDLKSKFKINNRIETIYYGLPASPTFKLIKKSRKHENIKVIVSAGRLVDQKDFFTLIKAFDLVTRRFKNVELRIIGDGPLRQSIEKFISTLSSKRKIVLLGWKQRIRPYIRKASVFVLATKREGFPYVLLEALMENKPIIASNVPSGPSEMLGGGRYGVLVPKEDISALSTSILKVIGNTKSLKYYSRMSSIRGVFFTEDRMLNRYVRIIYNISPRKPQNKN